jgi:hypothetical protein
MEIEEVPEYIKRFMVTLCYGCDETSQCCRYGIDIDSGVYSDGDGRDDDPAEGIETKLMPESEAEVAEISELGPKMPAQMASHDASSDATSEMDLTSAGTFDDAIREALERKSARERNVAGSTGEAGGAKGRREKRNDESDVHCTCAAAPKTKQSLALFFYPLFYRVFWAFRNKGGSKTRKNFPPKIPSGLITKNAALPPPSVVLLDFFYRVFGRFVTRDKGSSNTRLKKSRKVSRSRSRQKKHSRHFHSLTSFLFHGASWGRQGGGGGSRPIYGPQCCFWWYQWCFFGIMHISGSLQMTPSCYFGDYADGDCVTSMVF